MAQHTTPWLWALAAVFVSGVSVGVTIALASSRDEPKHAEERRPLHSDAPSETSPAARRPESGAARGNAFSQPEVSGLVGSSRGADAEASSLRMCDGDTCFDGVGESASEILQRLEAAYRERWGPGQLDEPVDSASDEAETASLSEVEQSQRREGSEETEHALLAQPHDELRESSAPATDDDVESESESELVASNSLGTVAEGSAVTHFTQTNNQQVVVVQAPMLIATNALPRPDPATDASRPQPARGNERVSVAAVLNGQTARSALGPGFAAGSPLGWSLPASSASRTRLRPGTPQSVLGRSPWEPIDMSRQHNPWESTRLP